MLDRLDATAPWNEEADVLIFGSGGAGLAAAAFAAMKQFKVILCEKTAQFGGTTTTSGGVVWIPCSAQAKAARVEDSIDRAREYLRQELGNFYREDLVEAFLSSGPEALARLEAGTEVKFELSSWPDYHPHRPGGVVFGRSLQTVDFDARKLGKDFDLVRAPIKSLMLFGGLQLDKRKIDDFLNPFRSFATLSRAVKVLIRYGIDRLSYSRGTDTRAGNALIGRLIYSLRRFKNVSLYESTPLVELISHGNKVIGAIVSRNGDPVRIRARYAVILATGGFPRNSEMIKELASSHLHCDTVAFEGNVGDGINAARRVGARIDKNMSAPAFWTPNSRIKNPDGTETTVLYGYLDRGRPGVIAINSEGRRFVNEADSYHDVVTAMFQHGAGQGKPFYFICDRKFVWRHGLGSIRPFRWSLNRYIKSGYILVGRTLSELANQIGILPESLISTVERHNDFARTGVDLDFGKGSNAYNLLTGEKDAGPNPNLRPIERGPFIALRIYPSTLGTTLGVEINANAQVINESGIPIEGLYACGNDCSSVMRGYYPGAGATIAPGIAFGYKAIEHVSRQLAPQHS